MTTVLRLNSRQREKSGPGISVPLIPPLVKKRMAERGSAFDYDDPGQGVKDGARLRLRSKVMTVLTIVGSLLSIMWSHIMNHMRRKLLRFFASVGVVSFVFHSIWEMSQMVGYREMAGRPFLETAARCTPATFGDVAITFWIFALGALAAKTLSWGLRPHWNVFLTLGLLGAVHAIWIEQAATGSGRWTYTNSMPIIPGLDMGLWPVLQLVILTPLTVWFSSRYALKKTGPALASTSPSP